MQTSDEQKERLMQELISSLKERNEKKSFEMTIDEFAEATGLSRQSARRILYKKKETGEMTRRMINIDGRAIAVYSVI